MVYTRSGRSSVNGTEVFLKHKRNGLVVFDNKKITVTNKNGMNFFFKRWISLTFFYVFWKSFVVFCFQNQNKINKVDLDISPQRRINIVKLQVRLILEILLTPHRNTVNSCAVNGTARKSWHVPSPSLHKQTNVASVAIDVLQTKLHLYFSKKLKKLWTYPYIPYAK